MRISDRYIGRQILTGTLFAILLLSILLVLGNVFQKIRPLLVEINAPVSILWSFILSALPVSLIYTIPWGFLSAVLLVFGRMSSDNELNSFRTAGVSLVRLALPVFFLGAALSTLCLWLNIEVAPEAKKQVDGIVTRTIIRDPRALLRAGVDQSSFKNLRIYSEYSQGDVFHNFHIFKMDDPRTGSGSAYIHAGTATTVVDEEKQQIRLRLTGAYSDGTTSAGDKHSLVSEELEWIAIDYSQNAVRAPKIGAMTNREIEEFLARWSQPPPGADEDLVKLNETVRSNFRNESIRRHASSLACLAFAVIGVPLGIKARRRDTSSGLVISLAIGAAYFIIGGMLGDVGAKTWLIWLPNLVCVTLGFILFRRARFR